MIRTHLEMMRAYSWRHNAIWTVMALSLRMHAYALANAQAKPPKDGNSASSTSSCQNLLDMPQLQQRIRSGRVYQRFNFLSEDEVRSMWEEIHQLEDSGGFGRSGLSNTVQGSNQQFGTNDRTLCPAPWWVDSLEGNELAKTTNTGIPPIAARIQDLRLSLSSLLDRPTMQDASLAHECYYSMSTIGSSLARHMDERHEELKGAKGWLLPSRRSLSWLVYLSDPEEWSLEEHGGALRSFVPQSSVVDVDGKREGGKLAQDEGNLQIGWLLNNRDDINSDSSSKSEPAQQPVYLDSWFPISTQPAGEPEPHCVLYSRNAQQEKVILTKPWLTENLQGISVPDFLQNWALRQSSSGDDDKDDSSKNSDHEGVFLERKYAQQFALIEDRPGWDTGSDPIGTVAEDILPKRGSLVVFDSVIVPHQVQLIQKGKRVALAGWFHEVTQPFPEGLYS